MEGKLPLTSSNMHSGPEQGGLPRAQANIPSRTEKRRTKMIANVMEPEAAKRGPAIPELSDQLEKELVQVFKLLSDETRLRVLTYLAREGELHVTALCDKLGQSQPAVSHHLALLRVAGLIEARRDGKHNFYSVRVKHFHRLMTEVFDSVGEPGTEEIRFQDFVLTHGA
jgi:ArsR family transcriptional regulator, arsenate/arsenite/antimonite-responsive transcriptional repressor